ncbi:acetolactate synthase-1/2/3 large subunit [Enhydrobacter aerosaccus]|uniref:Acetolactate synthase-1/2/3 large subunit n=1 Tax=Enhydrobacter aerosaccus TaxID=225324 RepID=A0A1T4L343_9HYPH|nr:thiamine pyrophosphate-dependent enzyme [Enhydrobacter aerosaccus]SJZ49008.1 acetolactate synthase-1/2/3 large subunit [Enhydrobacter aerosaccus]
MQTLTTAQAVVSMLELNGIDTLFCLPGVQNDAFFDALYDRTNAIRPIHTRHEQACAYMALGYAMATGGPSAYVVVPGPGFLNTTAALSTAYAVNAPVLALTGQIQQSMIGRNVGLLHELPDQLAIMRGLTKWADRVTSPASAPALMNEAFRRLLSGRRRPVALECAMDTWARKAPVELPSTPAGRDPCPVDEEAIDKAARLLGAAKRPLIVVGGGAQEAGHFVQEIAEMLDAPVMTGRMGQGVIDGRHRLSVTAFAGYRFWAEADVVLAVGTRLQPQQMNWGLDDDLKVIRIDIDGEELDRHRKPEIGIIGDAAATLKVLAARLALHNAKRNGRAEAVAEIKAAATKTVRETLAPQISYLDAIRAALPEDGILVDELTQMGYAARLAYPTYKPRTFLSPGYQGTLGWGYATSLGAKVAKPDVPVVSISGDGGFLFTAMEMSTAAQNDIGVVAIVFSDGAYGNVRRIQQQSYNNRTIATDLHNPDFVKLAESFGVAAERVSSPAELRAALSRRIANGKPALIHCPVGSLPDPWSLVALPRARPRRA